MITKKAQIINELGLHARPASLFVNTAMKYKSNIHLTCGDKKGEAKSILNVLALSAAKHDFLEITAEGEDEQEAAETLVKLIESGFSEE